MSADWPCVVLGEVLRLALAPEQVVADRSYPSFGVYGFGRGLFQKSPLSGAEIRAEKLFRVRTGQFVYSRLKAFEGAFALVPPTLDGCYVTNEFPTFDFDESRLRPAYLDWYFRRPSAWTDAARFSVGIGARRERLHPEQFLSLQIPLPPLAEQRRIVSRVNAIAARIADARCLRGEVEDERNALVVSERNRSFTELAERFESKPLGRISDCRLGKMLSGNQASGTEGVPYLRNANVQWDHFDLSSVYRIVISPTEQEELALRTDDILVCEGGDIGKCAIWREEIPGCVFQKALHRVRADLTVSVPRYLLHHFIWAAEKGDFSAIQTQTTIPHLTGVMLKQYRVVLPPLAEQHRIVAHLDTLQAKADSLRSLQAEASAELDALLPAVLAKAFAGEL